MKTPYSTFRKNFLILVAGLSFVGSSGAAITLTDTAGFATVTLTEPLTFQATSSVTTAPVVFFSLIAEDYFTSDAAPLSGTPQTGGIPTSNSANTIASVISTNSPTIGLYDRNDLLISFVSTTNINTGDFITFNPGSFTTNLLFADLPSVNPTTSVVVVNNFNDAISLSQTVNVPEPSGLMIFGVAGIAFASRRFRQSPAS